MSLKKRLRESRIRRLGFVWAMSLALMINALSPARLNSQGTTAAIQGLVTDTSGAAVPDAQVQITNTETGNKQTRLTDAAGRYIVPDLPVGNYEVQVSKMGFSTLVHTGITLTVGNQSVVDFALTVGAQAQTITVEAQASQVDTTNATIGSYTSEQQMSELPLNGRDFEQLIQLAPGVNTLTAFDPSGLQGRAPEYSIAGGRPTGQVILLDDENLEGFWNKGIGSVVGTSLGIEAIGEFQTLTNSYSAQFAGDSGVVNAVSKSGTNSFHGSGYEFIRNSALDARSFIQSYVPPFRRNQYGGSLGGPIKKDKAFFFVNYEGLRQELGETSVASVPACNVAGVCTPLFPQSANPAAYKAILNTLALFPLPNIPGSVSNGIGLATVQGNQIAHEDYVLAKFDYNLSDKDSIVARYISDKASFLEPFGGASYFGGPLPTWPEFDQSHSTFSILEWRRIITPNLVNVARVSYSLPYSNGSSPFSAPTLDLFPGSGRANADIEILGLSGLGGPNLAPYTLAPNKYTEGDDMIWNRGAHEIKFGIVITRDTINETLPLGANSQWIFFGLGSFLGGGVTPGTGVGQLQYVPTTLPNGQASYNPRDFRYTEVLPYIQDNWKVSKKLTVNLGLRWDFQTNAYDAHNQLYNITNFQTATGFTHVSNVSKTNSNWTNFAPRVGFAYDPFADHKTSIRAGFGMFYQPAVAADFAGYPGAYPFPVAEVGQAVPGSVIPVYPNIPTNAALAQPSTGSLWNWLSSRTPYLMQYNFNVQREIAPSTLLSVGYVGSRGVHLISPLEQNPNVLIDGKAGFLDPTGSVVIDNPRVNPNLGSMAMLTPETTSRYNSLQVSAIHRFRHNLQAQLFYTFSKCIDDGGYYSTFNTGAFSQGDPYNQGYDKGLCSYDVTHVLTANGLYALPFHGNRIVEGWQVSGVETFNNGLPFTVSDGIDASGFGTVNTTARPNVNPGFSNDPIIGSVAEWFNPAAFSLQPIGTNGDLGRNTLRGPHLADTDFALLKDTRISERVRVQFRAEFFNIFNHSNYALPNSSLYVGLYDGQPIPNPNAGRITAIVGTPRQIQFALKFLF